MINGIINVYKEAGFTSHDVVAKLRGILKQKKIGHTGTLDPDAIGVLPVCLGKGTKVSDILTDTDKEYVAKFQLGITTDTQDISGKILRQSDITVTKETIVTAIQSYVGEIQQVPPMYSALKVNGKKLYELAREGIEIERKARTITIYNIDVIEIVDNIITIKVLCSKGTYIRTLCHDIGESLGCGATMLSLKRTKVSLFSIEDSITLGQIRNLVEQDQIEAYIIPIEDIFKEYEEINVLEEAERFLYNGNKLYEHHFQDVLKDSIFRKDPIMKDSIMEDSIIKDSLIEGSILDQSLINDPSKVTNILKKYRVYDSNNHFIAIYQLNPEEKELIPIKMFKE